MEAAHLMVGRAPSSPRRRSGYRPPEQISQQSITEALSGTPRDNLAAPQLDLFVSKGATGSGRTTLRLAGDPALLKTRCVSVIGTRNVSEFGAKRAHRFARELATAGITVVSGLAAGVDTYALTSAIKAGGRVIAVIGTPLGQAYPAENAALQEQIYRDHLLVSQFEEGQRVFRSNFPERNRTMAAISDGSVIIEASESSGTLHQAIECQKLGRWLGIAKSVVEDSRLTWPERFLSYEKCIVLDDTAAFISKVYG
jgi:DNA processing protein